jgi:hypothetical protein
VGERERKRGGGEGSISLFCVYLYIFSPYLSPSFSLLFNRSSKERGKEAMQLTQLSVFNASDRLTIAIELLSCVTARTAEAALGLVSRMCKVRGDGKERGLFGDIEGEEFCIRHADQFINTLTFPLLLLAHLVLLVLLAPIR